MKTKNIKNAIRITLVQKYGEVYLEIGLRSRKFVLNGDLWLLAKVVMYTNAQTRQALNAAVEYLCERAYFVHGETVKRSMALKAANEAIRQLMLSRLNEATKQDRVTVEF